MKMKKFINSPETITDEELVGRSITIPQDIVDNILGEKALYQGRSNINGTYSVKKFAVAVPVLSSESQLVGIVLAVMDESEIMQVWRSFIGMFLMTSAIILLISFLASSVTSMPVSYTHLTLPTT